MNRHSFDRLWLVLTVIILVFLIWNYIRGAYCDYLAVDFRGYYATGQTFQQEGDGAGGKTLFVSIYDPQTQAERQAALPLNCPDGTVRPPLARVMVPYLPIFIPLFSLLARLDLTGSYAWWSLVNLVGLVLYLQHFSICLTGKTNWHKLFQWLICFPVLANLSLGQINVLLVVFLGEFVLAFRRGDHRLSGAWLGGVLLKPHLLILLLPGLLITRQWKVLLGFGVSATLLLGTSWLLAGTGGMLAWFKVVTSFAEPSFNSILHMMNGRGLAFNLERFLPSWLAWLASVVLMTGVALAVLFLWARCRRPGDCRQDFTYLSFEVRPISQFMWLMLATLAGTFVVSWHSNLYLGMLLLPFLFVLDLEGQVPFPVLAFWVFGPPVIYGSVFLFRPELAQPALAMALLAFNCFLVGYAARDLWAALPTP